ncbi:MAG: hypothetical protein ACRC1W_01180, partial [Shewanella sp.]
AYNNLNGKEMGKSQLASFHRGLKKDIDAKKIDTSMPFGIECIEVEKRVSAALKKMNGHKVLVTCQVVDINSKVVAEKATFKKIEAKKVITLSAIEPEGKNIALPSIKATSDAQRINKVTPSVPKFSNIKGLGFLSADKAPAKPANVFHLSGEIGKLLGNLQAYKLEIVIDGETHSGKSEIGKQVADAFLSAGYSVGWVDWEQGGLESRDTMESIQRNVKPENRKSLMVSSEVPKTLHAVKSLAGKFDVIVLDSGSSLKMITNAWIDELREQHPYTIWVILMQQNGKGGTRGGTAAEFDSPVVLKTFRPDINDYKKNYAYQYKNRGNPDQVGKYYLIAVKKIVKEEPAKEVKLQETEKKNL